MPTVETVYAIQYGYIICTELSNGGESQRKVKDYDGIDCRSKREGSNR